MKSQVSSNSRSDLTGKTNHHVGAECQFRTRQPRSGPRLFLRNARDDSGGACGAELHRSRIAAEGGHGGPAAYRRIRASAPIRSASQSMGSMELRRSRGSSVSLKDAPEQPGPAKRVDGRPRQSARSRPQRPRLIPDKHQFLAAGGHEPFDLAKYCCGGQASRRAACLRNHAERTAVAATFLNLEIGPRLSSGNQLRLFEKGMREAVVGPDWGMAIPLRAEIESEPVRPA